MSQALQIMMIRNHSKFRLFLLLACFVVVQSALTANNSTDSIFTSFEKSKHVDERLAIALQFTRQNISDAKACYRLLYSALKDSAKATDQIQLGLTIKALGVVHYYQSSLDSALHYYNRAIATFKKAGNRSEYLKTLKNVGLIYSGQGDYPKAIDYYLQAHQVFEEANDTVGIAGNLNDIGNAFLLSANPRQGIEYQYSALKLLQDFNAPALKGNVYNSIGYAFEEMGKIDSAIFFYEISAEYKKEGGNIYSFLNTKNNLCSCYDEQDLVHKAIVCLEEILVVYQKINHSEGQLRTLTNIANAYGKSKQFHKAIKILIDVKPLLDSAGTVPIKMEYYRKLQWLTAETENYADAYKFQKLYENYKDTLFNEEKNKQLLEISTKYEVEKKNRELLEKESSLNAARNETLVAQLSVKTRDFWLIILGGVLLLLMLSSTVYIQMQRRKAELEKSLAVISERDRGTLAIIEAQEEERTRIAKDLHDGVGNHLFSVYLKWNNALKQFHEENPLNAELKQGSKMLHEAMMEVRNVSHQMMPKVLSQFGLIPAIEELLDRSLKPAKIQYNFEHRGLEYPMYKKLEIAVYRILQELITNVIKHSSATKVQVQIFSNKGFLILILEDNGKGINEGGKGNGMGFSSINSRLHTINGECNIAPGPYTGTLVTIRIPIKYEEK